MRYNEIILNGDSTGISATHSGCSIVNPIQASDSFIFIINKITQYNATCTQYLHLCLMCFSEDLKDHELRSKLWC
mgnify:CR=1 FL=1